MREESARVVVRCSDTHDRSPVSQKSWRLSGGSTKELGYKKRLVTGSFKNKSLRCCDLQYLLIESGLLGTYSSTMVSMVSIVQTVLPVVPPLLSGWRWACWRTKNEETRGPQAGFFTRLHCDSQANAR